MKLKTIPTEAEEQIKLVQWLKIKKLKHWHTPNSTFTRSWKQKNMNTALGVQAGIPDLFVIVGDGVIGIEIKRTKGGTVSSYQKEWIDLLNNACVPTKVCKGFEECKNFVETYLL